MNKRKIINPRASIAVSPEWSHVRNKDIIYHPQINQIKQDLNGFTINYVCRKYGISYAHVRYIIEHFKLESDELIMAIMVHPDKGEFIVTDRNKDQFARDQGLHPTSLNIVITGYKPSIRGWKLKNGGAITWYRTLPIKYPKTDLTVVE